MFVKCHTDSKVASKKSHVFHPDVATNMHKEGTANEFECGADRLCLCVNKLIANLLVSLLRPANKKNDPKQYGFSSDRSSKGWPVNIVSSRK